MLEIIRTKKLPICLFTMKINHMSEMLVLVIKSLFTLKNNHTTVNFVEKKCYYKKTILNTHMLKHIGDKPFECGTCRKTFALHDSHTKYMLIHTGEKSQKCGVCGK